MLAVLVAGGSNLLLLDEPINHMDIASRVRFEQALKEYDGTILAVVHDRYFIHELRHTDLGDQGWNRFKIICCRGVAF